MSRLTRSPTRPQSRWVLPPAQSIRTALDEGLAAEGLHHRRRREAVVDVLLATRGHESVEEVVGYLEACGIEVAPAAVSRAMLLLSQLRSAAVCPAANEPAQCGLLVCDYCGVVEEFADAQLDLAQVTVAALNGFDLESRSVELHGRCSRCSGDTRRVS